jgi:hypothetical protein
MIVTLWTGCAFGSDDGVAAFVVGDAQLLLGRHDVALALQAHGATLDRLVEVGHEDRFLVHPRRQQCRLVDDVRQVGADGSRRQASHMPQIDVVAELHMPHVDLEDRVAAVNVRAIDDHRAIEPAGTQQRRVQRLRTVCCRHDDDASIGIEAVHLNEQLVERLFALVVAADGADAASLAESVQLVDENDARRA